MYQTSGLLGFYGGKLRQTSAGDRFGLDSGFADADAGDRASVPNTPQFVNEFNRYCADAGKLPSDQFRVDVR